MEEIHFLVDEISEKLNSDMRSVLQQMKDPQSKKRVGFICKFTRELVRASAPVKQKSVPLQQVQNETRELKSLVQDVRNQVNTQRFLKIYPRHVQQPYYHPQMQPVPQPRAPLPQQPPMQPAPQQVLAQPVQQPSPPPAPQPPQEESAPTKETIQIDFSKEPPQTQEPALSTQSGEVSLIKESDSKQTVVSASIKNNTYTLVEPLLTDEDKKLLTEVKKEVEGNPKILKDKMKTYKQLQKSAKKLKIALDEDNDTTLMKLRYYLVRNILNLAQIEPLLHDEHITKIICEGVNKPLTIIRNGQELHTNVRLNHHEIINNLLLQIAKKTYQPLSIDEPILDASYKNFHVQGTLGSDIVLAKFIISKE